MGPESRFKIKVLKRLKQIPNLWCLKVNLRTINGIPDILGCKDGKFFAIELKDGTKLTKLQEHTIKNICDAGGFACEMNPQNMDDVLQKLKEL